MFNLVGARNRLTPLIQASDEVATLEDKLATDIDRLDALSKPAEDNHDEPSTPAVIDIRADGYTGFDSSDNALPLTDEEVTIAIDYGNALFRNAQAGGNDERSETRVARRLAKKHKLTVDVLDGIWSRASVLGDRRVLSRIGR